jgi:hypothetical protein
LLKSIAAALILTSLPGVLRAADAPVPAAAPTTTTTTGAPAETTEPRPAVVPVAPAPTPAPIAAPPPPPLSPSDVLPNAGYVPGYRTFQSLSMAPNVPLVGAFPGGITPGFGAPMPPTAWTFKWTGFLNDSFQSSIGHRMVTEPDQTTVVFHVPPQTVDEYASFLGTNTMPGQWIQLNMSYGTPVVTANLSLSTWNPTDPTTYYQIGSQNFINNAYLQYLIPPLGDWKLRAMAGYFYMNYGALAQYGLGMYTNAIVALVRGVGEDVVGEYKISPTVTLLLDEGFMGNRAGQTPDGTIPDAGNGNANPAYPAAWIAHVHAGLAVNGPTTFKLNTHFLVNWAMDDRVQCQSASILVPAGDTTDACFDNPTYRQFDSAHVPDAHLYVAGIDGSVNHPIWGYLGVAASYTEGANVSTLRGVATYGGEGPWLVDRWWGGGTSGSGSLYVGGLNYTGSLRRILSAPLPAPREAPDLVINAGAIIAYTTTNNSTALSGAQMLDSAVTMPAPVPLPSGVDPFNHRLRYKFGVDALYTMTSWLSAGLRVDRVAPTNKDADETFYVLAPRVVFKTNWFARESFTLLYGKWFYGANTHPDASSIVPPDGRLDDQLIALNVNIWW